MSNYPGASLIRSVVVLVATAVVVAYAASHVWHVTIDDAGISYAYARHLIEGDGPVAVVGGPIIEGYSNPLWVFVLTPFAWLGESLAPISKWLGVLFYAVALGAGMRIVGLIHGRRWFELDFADLVVPLALSLGMQFIVWVPGGLENALYAAGMLSLALLDVQESRDPERRPYSALAAVAVALTRPEGVMYGLLFAGLKAAHALVSRQHVRQAAAYALLFAVPLAAYHIGHYVVFLDVVPNTFHAKPHAADRFAEALEYAEKFGPNTGFLYLVPLILLGLVGNVRQKVGLVALFAGAIVFLFYTGGDWMPFGRFLTFGLSPLAVLAALGVDNVSRFGSALSRGRVPSSALAVAGTALFGLPWWQFHLPELERIEQKKSACHLCHRVDDMKALEKLRQRLTLPSATLLIHDFGGPSWLSSKEIYPMDLLGLCDHTLARFQRYRREERAEDAYLLRFRYALHEQGEFPTFVYFPPNFWKGFKESPEFEFGYLPMSRKHLGKDHRTDAVFAVHRGKYIDYFPPVDAFRNEPVGSRLILLGSSVRPGSKPERTLLTVALLPTRDWDGTPVDVRVVFRSGGEEQSSDTVALFPKDVPTKGRWHVGEPRRIDFELKASHDRLTELALEVGESKSAPERVSLARSAGAPLAVVPMPRFPDDLPAARDERLRALEPRVHEIVARRFLRGDQTLKDEGLAGELEALGEALEGAEQREQAYLAYVWATRADRALLRRLYGRLEALRDLSPSRRFSREIGLLQQAYASRDDFWFIRLAAHYVQEGALAKARYFLARIRNREPFAAEVRVLESGGEARKGDLPPTVKGRLVAGAGQGGPGKGAKGERRSSKAASRPFVIDGRTLSLLIGGGGARAKVELVVDGAAVRTASGTGEVSLRPVFWDVSELKGKSGQLRVSGGSKKKKAKKVVLDEIQLWD